jgi:hypothetical protein
MFESAGRRLSLLAVALVASGVVTGASDPWAQGPRQVSGATRTWVGS